MDNEQEVAEAIIQLLATYTGRRTYSSFQDWLEEVDFLIGELAEKFGHAFTPQITETDGSTDRFVIVNESFGGPVGEGYGYHLVGWDGDTYAYEELEDVTRERDELAEYHGNPDLKVYRLVEV